MQHEPDLVRQAPPRWLLLRRLFDLILDALKVSKGEQAGLTIVEPKGIFSVPEVDLSIN